MKKYLVTLTVEYECGIFQLNIEAPNADKAAAYGKNKLETEYPIYRNLSRVYSVKEA